MVAGQQGMAFKPFHQLARFPQDLMGRQELKATLFDLVQQEGVDLGHEGSQPHKIRTDGVQGRRRVSGMGLGPLRPAQAEDDILAQFDTSLSDETSGRDLLVGGAAFLDPLQHLVVAAFQPHVDPAQAGCAENLQILQPFLHDIAGRPVDRYSLKFREAFDGMPADGRQLAGGHGDGVAGREKKRLHALPVFGARGVDVRTNIFDRPDPVRRALLVDHAEGALVVRAAHRGLNQQAVGLARRAVDGAFKMQNGSFPS